MNIIFISTTRGNLQNLAALNFQSSFSDTEEKGGASFTYSKINDNLLFVVSSELNAFFSGRPDVIFEDERYEALRIFIETKVNELDPNNTLEKSYYAFHSHNDIFDEETFRGKSDYLSDENHIVWGFTHQESDDLYKIISNGDNILSIATSIITRMEKK